MKASVTASLAFAGLVAANACNNNCGRQVVGTALSKPPFADRLSMCSAFLATTTTFTPTAATATSPVQYNKRNVHNRAAPSITGTVPAYATSCPDVTAYWSACQCFSSGVTVTPTTVTITAATPTVTVAGPVCDEGLAYNMYWFPYGSSGENILDASQYENVPIDYQSLFQGASPVMTGTSPMIGNVEEYYYYGPLSFSGVTAPDSTTMEGAVVMYTGYLHPSYTGDYVITFTDIDDSLGIWYGSPATGTFNQDNVAMYHPLGTPGPLTITVTEAGGYIPLRIVWANDNGPAGLEITMTDPNGNVILATDSTKNPQILSGCSGGAVPAFT